MPRILTVDDSRAIRSIVTKQVTELGFEVDEAENGEEGLARLEECTYDLVLLDVTIRVMDGPTLLTTLREKGDKTPVLMLTSESKRSVVAGAMKAGIDDYILKPFKPEELRGKILKSLKLEGRTPVVGVPAAPAAEAPRAEVGGTAGKSFVDVLVVDAMENVHKKLRSLFPAHVSLNGVASAQAALGACRDKGFRVALVDTEMPDVSSQVLLSQLRALQPHATFLGLCLRTSNDADVRALGFDGVLFKPFDPGRVEDFLVTHFDNQDLLAAEDNLARASAFAGKEDRIERYFKRLEARPEMHFLGVKPGRGPSSATDAHRLTRAECHRDPLDFAFSAGPLEDLMEPVLSRAAAACFDEVIFDVTKVPARPDRTPRLILCVQKQAKRLGIELRLVGTPEIKATLGGISETATIPFHLTLPEARAAAA